MKLLIVHALLCASLCVSASTALVAADKKKDAAKDEAVEQDIPGDPAKFFLFHKEGVTTDQVRGDLVHCISQARPILSMRDRMPSNGGLLGALINGRMAEIDRFRMRNAAMRKCMGMIGYDRYLVPEDIWNPMVAEGDIVVTNDGLVDIDVIERMVAFASGPKPAGEKLPL
jgi:hypothetical protein